MTDKRTRAARLAVAVLAALVVSLALGGLAGGVSFAAVVLGATVFDRIWSVDESFTRTWNASAVLAARDTRGQTDARRTAKAAAGIVSTAGLAGLVEQYVLGGIIYQTGLSIIGAIDGAANVFLAPFRAFGDGLGNLVGAIVNSPISIIEMSADYTGFVITRGEWGVFGPLTFAVGVASVMAGLWVATQALRRLELRPWRLFRGLR